MNEKWSDALERFLLNEKGEVNLSSQVPRLLIGPLCQSILLLPPGALLKFFA